MWHSLYHGKLRLTNNEGQISDEGTFDVMVMSSLLSSLLPVALLGLLWLAQRQNTDHGNENSTGCPSSIFPTVHFYCGI